METARLIGVTGAGRGTGTTHLSLLGANYLAGCCGRRTALLEWNGHGDLAALGEALLGRNRSRENSPGEPYRLLDVDYYQRGGPELLSDCMAGSYEDIIMDLGELREEIRREWLRCDVIILTASLTEWKVQAFLEFLAGEKRLDSRWIYTAAFGSEDTRSAVERQFRISLRRIPFLPDAFRIDRAAMRWLEELLGLG